MVARVDKRSEPGAHFVYFKVVDQPYYFVVVLRAGGEERLALSATYWEADVRVYVRIISEKLTASEITARLNRSPTRTWSMGEARFKRNPKGRKHADHAWMFEPQEGVPGTVEEKLGVLLDAMGSLSDQVTLLTSCCDVEVVVVYSAWGGDPQFGGIQIASEAVDRLAALGARLDVDLYAYGPPMRGD